MMNLNRDFYNFCLYRSAVSLRGQGHFQFSQCTQQSSRPESCLTEHLLSSFLLRKTQQKTSQRKYRWRYFFFGGGLVKLILGKITFEFFHEFVVILKSALQDRLWVIHLPSPLCADWIGVMPLLKNVNEKLNQCIKVIGTVRTGLNLGKLN